jgi:hypothetical protein
MQEVTGKTEDSNGLNYDVVLGDRVPYEVGSSVVPVKRFRGGKCLLEFPPIECEKCGGNENFFMFMVGEYGWSTRDLIEAAYSYVYDHCCSIKGTDAFRMAFGDGEGVVGRLVTFGEFDRVVVSLHNPFAVLVGALLAPPSLYKEGLRLLNLASTPTVPFGSYGMSAVKVANQLVVDHKFDEQEYKDVLASASGFTIFEKFFKPFSTRTLKAVLDERKGRRSHGIFDEFYSRLDKSMRSPITYDMVGPHLTRVLFEKGYIDSKKKVPIDIQEAANIIGREVVMSYNIQASWLLAMFVATTDCDARAYMMNLLGSDGYRVFYELSSIMGNLTQLELNDMVGGVVNISRAGKKMATSVHLATSMNDYLSKFVHILPGIKYSGRGLRPGIYGISTKKIYTTLGNFNNIYGKLRKWRNYRARLVIPDTVMKPCSSFETFMYGNRYATGAKWLYVFYIFGPGKYFLGGTGTYGTWYHVFKRFFCEEIKSGKCSATNVDIINPNKYCRENFKQGDAFELAAKDLNDFVLLDLEVPGSLDQYMGIFARSLRGAVIKVLPRFGAVAISFILKAAFAHKFEFLGPSRCGRLHNGEMLLVFYRPTTNHKAKIPPQQMFGDYDFDEENVPLDSVDSDDAEGSFNVEHMDEEERIMANERLASELLPEFVQDNLHLVLGAMQDSMVVGEMIRRRNFAAILAGDLTLSGKGVIFEEVVESMRIVKRFVKSSGNMNSYLN